MPDNLYTTAAQRAASATNMVVGNGWIVVTHYRAAQRPEHVPTYDHFTRFDDALDYFDAHAGDDEFPSVCICPAKDGIPLAGALRPETIKAYRLVVGANPGAYSRPIRDRAHPDTPENAALRQRAIFNGTWDVPR